MKAATPRRGRGLSRGGWGPLNETDVAPSKLTELAREGQDEENGLNGGRWMREIRAKSA
jgi:hypothetical protein